MSRTAMLALSVVATERTFQRVTHRGQTLWVGKCIHCGSKLSVGLDGALLGDASIEHIVPRSHGGTEAPQNLALACAGCNHEKGRRHDNRAREDARRIELQQRLQHERARRWRDAE
jgi:5-methylcytosine-specific restriction endonuclease McrA